MFRLAERTERIDSSGIRRVFDLAASLKDPINLSIGQPDFDVPDEVKAAAKAAIDEGGNKYTATQGLPELRGQLRLEALGFTGRDYAEDELIVTSGVSGGLFLACCALIQPGDEVIIPDPYFVMYKHLVSLFGGTAVYLDTYADGFGVDPDRLEDAITPATRLLLLNSPANPTGAVLPRERLEAIAAVCGRHDLPVVSDEIYRDFAYVPVPSIAALHPQTLLLGGHSKRYGMTGWRLGYAAGPAAVIQTMAKIQQYSFVCAPSITQYAALACPRVDSSANIEAYRRKRDLMVARLSGTFEVGTPDGAFYIFAKPPAPWTGDAFAEHAIANNVLIIPGSIFSESGSHFRICYTVPDEQLRAGADRLCELAR